MSNQACARCGVEIVAAEAAYSSDGLICQTCELADLEHDAEQMRAAENMDSAGLPGLSGGPLFSVTSTRVEARNADGSSSVQEHTDVDGWGMRFFRALFKK
jgi:hypothetical protein